jgi:hypothetical protein
MKKNDNQFLPPTPRKEKEVQNTSLLFSMLFKSRVLFYGLSRGVFFSSKTNVQNKNFQ